MDKIPLNYEASQGDTNKQETPSLPPELIQCLENARFLHLATCADNVPQVSLMNYTYLPSSPHSRSPVIVMTSNTASRKTSNIAANSNVSLLVHDWVSHRPPQTRRPSAPRTQSPDHRSSLAALLFNINSSAVSSISATIAGTARIAPPASPEETFYLARHLQNNTFDGNENENENENENDNDNDNHSHNHNHQDNHSLDDDNSAQKTHKTNTAKPPPPVTNHPANTCSTTTTTAAHHNHNHNHHPADSDRRSSSSHFVAGDDVRVIVVDIKSVRISDFKGTVRDWVLVAKHDSGGLSDGNNGNVIGDQS